MEAKNMEELNAMLLKELRKAMNVTSEKVLADMHEETGKFYTSGKPVVYVRTGALGDTPKVTALNVQGNKIEFDAYLDTSHRYTTGKHPSMLDVLNLADKKITNSSVGYLRTTAGQGGFWERSEKKMKKSFERTMGKSFRKGVK